MDTRHLFVVVGARPNFMKVAPVLQALAGMPRFRVSLVHTGQHYAPEMSGDFLRDLGMGNPDFHLDVGSGSHAVQTALILQRFEPLLFEHRPHLVVVAGDVNSTLACSLAAVKLEVPVAHIEAGLRSRDRSMPEEINRLVTDALSEILFTTSPDAGANLRAEGVPADRIHFVGNTMIDTLRRFEAGARASEAPAKHGVSTGEYLLVTLHRPTNVDTEAGLARILRLLEAAGERLRVLFPVHPRTRASLARIGRWEQLASRSSIRLLPPLAYAEFLALMAQARLVLTDSGGVQEETTALGVPCLTLRPNTERPVTVDAGTNLLVSESVDAHLSLLDRFLAGRVQLARRLPEKWDGRAGERVAAVLHDHFAIR